VSLGRCVAFTWAYRRWARRSREGAAPPDPATYVVRARRPTAVATLFGVALVALAVVFRVTGETSQPQAIFTGLCGAAAIVGAFALGRLLRS